MGSLEKHEPNVGTSASSGAAVTGTTVDKKSATADKVLPEGNKTTNAERTVENEADDKRNIETKNTKVNSTRCKRLTSESSTHLLSVTLVSAVLLAPNWSLMSLNASVGSYLSTCQGQIIWVVPYMVVQSGAWHGCLQAETKASDITMWVLYEELVGILYQMGTSSVSKLSFNPSPQTRG